MCAEKQNVGITTVLHAVIEMVETAHRSYLAGGGFKPHRGVRQLPEAMVLSVYEKAMP